MAGIDSGGWIQSYGDIQRSMVQRCSLLLIPFTFVSFTYCLKLPLCYAHSFDSRDASNSSLVSIIVRDLVFPLLYLEPGVIDAICCNQTVISTIP